MNEETMESNIPALGTRFIYTRTEETCYAESFSISEQWIGTVIQTYEDSSGSLNVVARRDDGAIETFHNNSWNIGTVYEHIEIF
jgi:hypothetical protein